MTGEIIGSCSTGVTLQSSDSAPEKGEWYIDYPVKAVKDLTIDSIKVYRWNPGTSNLRVYVVYIDESGKETVISDNMEKDGSPGAILSMR